MKQSLFSICLNVIKDPRVIIIAILSIFFILLANYVVKYRRKPKTRVKRAKPAPAPAKSEEKKEGEEEHTDEHEANSQHK